MLSLGEVPCAQAIQAACQAAAVEALAAEVNEKVEHLSGCYKAPLQTLKRIWLLPMAYREFDVHQLPEQTDSILF